MNSDPINYKKEIQSILKKYNIKEGWPQESLKETSKISGTQIKFNNRKDFTKKAFITIDGKDAKDFDDALFCEEKENFYNLYVAIADVSEYINIESALDEEALRRGTSIYFPNYVIPMFPKEISNGVCSLKEKENRYTITCKLKIGSDGSLIKYSFLKSIISSHLRCTYSMVQNFLENTDKYEELSDEIKKNILSLNKIAKILIKKRKKRDAIEFITNESYFTFDEDNQIKEVKLRERLFSHKIVEECMIIANVAASKFIKKNNFPCLYRVHEKPPREKVEETANLLKDLGYRLSKDGDLKQKDFNKITLQAKKNQELNFITPLLLRTMSHAEYSPNNLGHYGLALKEYCHFTSPIRRYPDLVIHRIIKKIIDKKKTSFAKKTLKIIGEKNSESEKIAENSEREIINFLICHIAKNLEGKIFDAIVVSVVNFGLFINTIENGISGLIHISTLGNEYFIHDERNNLLIGEKTGTKFKIGTALKVKLIKSLPNEKKIDFTIVK